MKLFWKWALLVLGAALSGAGGALVTQWYEARQLELEHPCPCARVVPEDFHP